MKLIDYKSVKEIISEDRYGYKYKVILANLLDNKTPNKFMKNPFVIYNCKLFLQINYPNYEWIDDNQFVGCKYKHMFICKNHLDKGIQYNSFDNIVNNHHACKYCSYEKMKNSRIKEESDIIDLCISKKIIYKDRYTKNHESIIQYICEKHSENGIQEMSLSHLKASCVPCHFCGITAGEKIISNYLDSHNVDYIMQKTFCDCIYIKELRFDFYLPSKNICIEFDGEQHYMPIQFGCNVDAEKSFQLTKYRDKIKNDYCKNNNIELIRIPYWEINNIDKILQCKI